MEATSASCIPIGLSPSVPLHRELKRGTLHGILRDAGISAAELRELL